MTKYILGFIIAASLISSPAFGFILGNQSGVMAKTRERVKHISIVEPIVLVDVTDWDSDATDTIFTSQPIYMGNKRGEFSAVLGITQGTGTFGVNAWYQISNVSVTSLSTTYYKGALPVASWRNAEGKKASQREITHTWYTPASPNLVSRSTVGTTAQSVNLIASRWVRFLTDITGTVRYKLIVNAF